MEGEPPGDEFTVSSIPRGASKSLSLFAKLRAEGFHAVTARIPEDRLPADDQRSLVVRAIKEVRVLLIDGEPGNEPRDSETYFLKHALAPVAPDAAAGYFIKTTTLTPPELPQARLDEFDPIILANVPDFSEAALKAFQSYLRRGGGLMIFPGGLLNASFYNEQLFKRLNFLPAEIAPPRAQPHQDEHHFP